MSNASEVILPHLRGGGGCTEILLWDLFRPIKPLISKISIFMITELFYSQNMNRGILHTRSYTSQFLDR